MDSGIYIDGIDLYEFWTTNKKQVNKHVYLSLASVEEFIFDEEVLDKLRKIIKDNFNDYSRTIEHLVIGHIEVSNGRPNIQREDVAKQAGEVG